MANDSPARGMKWFHDVANDHFTTHTCGRLAIHVSPTTDVRPEVDVYYTTDTAFVLNARPNARIVIDDSYTEYLCLWL